MRIKTVTYFKTFPVGSYWEKIGMEAELSGDEDAKQALTVLQQQVDEFFKEAHPNNGQVTVVKTIEEPKRTPEEKMIGQINEITDTKILESFKLLAAKYPNVKQVYDDKMNALLMKDAEIKSIIAKADALCKNHKTA